MPWPWKLGYGSIEVIGNVTIRQSAYDFLLTFYSNYGSISCDFWDIRHTGVRPRSDAAPSRWAALARCGGSGHVRARLDVMRVSSRPGARLLVWAVRAGRSGRWAAASPFGRPRLARRPRVPAERVWSSCLCGGCAGGLGLAVGWAAGPGSPQCRLPAQLEDVPVSTILGTLSALEALCDYALYKSTFTLHYITFNVEKYRDLEIPL